MDNQETYLVQFKRGRPSKKKPISEIINLIGFENQLNEEQIKKEIKNNPKIITTKESFEYKYFTLRIYFMVTNYQGYIVLDNNNEYYLNNANYQFLIGLTDAKQLTELFCHMPHGDFSEIYKNDKGIIIGIEMDDPNDLTFEDIFEYKDFDPTKTFKTKEYVEFELKLIVDAIILYLERANLD
ncbi:Hypothetical protein KVN_LOCUS509 [uncultured virus]|nr:Hypothetical protein KVN_LOCUS509 [uncultured virus]